MQCLLTTCWSKAEGSFPSAGPRLAEGRIVEEQPAVELTAAELPAGRPSLLAEVSGPAEALNSVDCSADGTALALAASMKIASEAAWELPFARAWLAQQSEARLWHFAGYSLLGIRGFARCQTEPPDTRLYLACLRFFRTCTDHDRSDE